MFNFFFTEKIDEREEEEEKNKRKTKNCHAYLRKTDLFNIFIHINLYIDREKEREQTTEVGEQREKIHYTLHIYHSNWTQIEKRN